MRRALTWMSALMLCGCLGRAKPDLLQARLREQQNYVAEVERQMETAQADLQRARRESEQLRAELARSGKNVMAAEYSESLIRASKLQINSLMSGGLNRDDNPGDDALVAYISLVDEDGEVIKLPGTVDLTLIDPSLPEPNREIGKWRFSAEECRSKWTRGFTGSGYQFTMPLDEPVQHEQLVLHARLTTADKREFDASHLVRVGPPQELERRQRVEPGDVPQQLDDIADPPPPAGNFAPARAEIPDWEEPSNAVVPAVRESTNWKRDEVPVRR